MDPRAFFYEIQTVQIPPRFRLPTNVSKYDGETNPSIWLDDFRLACRAGGATSDEVVIRNLPLYLVDSELEHLSAGPILDWTSLGETIVGNFQGTCARPDKSWDLR